MRIGVLLLPLAMMVAGMDRMASAAELVLVAEGKPRAALVIAADAAPQVRDAAAAMRRYIEKMSGARLPLIDKDQEGGQMPGVRIFIGASPATRAMMDADELAGLGAEGFIIRARDDAVVIVGNTDLGTQHGVYDFMQRELGIRWYWPGELGEVVPVRSTITVSPANRVETPDFPMRHWRGGFNKDWAWFLTDADYRHFLAAAKVNQGNALAMGHAYSDLLTLGYQAVTGNENATFINIRGELAEQHPEWFSMRGNGTRIDPRVKHFQLCTSNQELIDYIVNGVIHHFERRPEAMSLSLSPQDTNDFCACEACKAIDAEYGNLTDRIMLFNRQIIDRVNERFPEKGYGWYAYLGVRPPPQTVEVPEQLVVCLAPEPWNVAHALPWVESGVSGNDRIVRDLEGWHEKARHIVLREYYGLAMIFGPFPIEEAQAANFRLCHERFPQVIGFSSEWFHNWPMQGWNFYTISRLGWDADADWRAMLEEYCDKFFGPAGTTMLRYHDRIRAAAQQAAHEHGGGYKWLRGFTNEFNQGTENLLREALSEADTERQRQRIGLILDCYHARTLWQKIRDNRDDIDQWRPRAEQLIDYLDRQMREPTFREYASEYGALRYRRLAQLSLQREEVVNRP